MLKKLIFVLLALLFWFPVSAQDEQKTIELTVNDSESRVLEYNVCRLSIMATEYDASDVTITISIENTDEGHPIFLFGHAYTEKDLKKNNIRFDKKSYGSTSKEILCCEGLEGDHILKIEPYENRLLTIKNVSGSGTRVVLPIYIARFEKKKLFGKERYLISQRAKVVADIKFIVEDKTDNEYDVIKNKYDELVVMIAEKSVCPHTNHPISKQQQIEDFKDKISDLKDEIADIKSEHRWKERDKEYKPYKELLSDIDKLEIKEEVCSRCKRNSAPAVRHSCRFCSQSPLDILILLERIYQKLDNSQISKSEANKEADSAHRAWTGGCVTLKQKMAADNATKTKVEKYYNEIVNY